MLTPNSWGSTLVEFNKCHSPEDGRFCSDPSLSVHKTPEKVQVRKGSWGDPDSYEYREDPTEQWGRDLKGKPVTVEELEKAGRTVLFHVTTDLDGVIRSGSLRAFESGGPEGRPGLGGGQHPAVSFSTDRASALNIMRVLGVARDLAKGAPFEKTIRAWAKRELAMVAKRYGGKDNVPYSVLDPLHDGLNAAVEAYRFNLKQREFSPAHPKAAFEARTAAAVDAFGLYLWSRDSAKVGKNPIMFVGAPKLRKIGRIGIVGVPVRNVPKGTLMNHGADKFQGEIEVHGDVPVRGASYTTASLLRRNLRRRGRRKLTEFNKCHNPGGSPAGGQFCSAADAFVPAPTALRPAGRYRSYDRGDFPTSGPPLALYHGSPTGSMGNGPIHVGSKRAATEALEARIGKPATGSWDGTREYGKTKLAGRRTLQRLDPRGYNMTGANARPADDDYYPSSRARFSDGTLIPLTAKPSVFPVEIVGEMTNAPWKPHEDFKANGLMAGQVRKGSAKRGYYYRNVAEDADSISAVVPSRRHLRRLSSREIRAREAAFREFNKCHNPAGSPAGGQFCSTVGATPAITGRWGTTPRSDYERNALWYSFPENGAYTAERLKSVPMAEIARELERRFFAEGDEGVVRYLVSLAPKVPKGMSLVLRIGDAKENTLAGTNAANPTGMVEFINQMTDDGDLSIAHGFEFKRKGRTPTLHFFAVSGMKLDPKGYRGEFKRGAWGR